MFSHNTQGGLYTNANVLDKNSEDPNADLFSILGQLHHLKLNDQRSAISKIDLNDYNEDKDIILTTKGYNYLYNPIFCFLSVKSTTTTTKEPTTTNKGPLNRHWGSGDQLLTIV